MKNEFNICLVMVWVSSHRWKSLFHQREGLGVAYLKSILQQKGYNVDVINAEILYLTNDEVVKRIMKKNYDIIGFSCTAQRTYIPSLDIIEKIRQLGYISHIILGGEFATLAHKEILEHSDKINSICLGEGEYTILELANTIKACKNDLSGISGLYWRNKDGNIKHNGLRERNYNLDKLPFPYRTEYRTTDLVKEIKAGVNYGRIVTSRGCYGSCTFCSTRYLYDNKSERVSRSPKNVAEEIEILYKDFGIDHVRFNDEVFYDGTEKSFQWIDQLMTYLENKNIKIIFDIQMRAADINQWIINYLKEKGLVYIFTGVESGSQGVLNRLNKTTTVEENTKAIEVLSKITGIKIELGFIMFEPEMNLLELEESYLWLKKHKKFATKHNIINKLNSLYKTKTYYQLLKLNLLEPGNFWDRYNFSFVDKRVKFILDTMEKIREKMHPVHERISYFKLQIKNMIINKELKKNIEKLQLKINKIEDIEKEYWFKLFEKLLFCAKNNKSPENLKKDNEEIQKEITYLFSDK